MAATTIEKFTGFSNDFRDECDIKAASDVVAPDANTVSLLRSETMSEPSLFAPARTVKRFQENEVWGSGKFSVDSEGSVWRGGRRAEHRTRTGYLQIKVMLKRVRYYTVAHRVVWLALHGPIPPGMVVNHINGIKDDNRPENLELMTYSENTSHAYRIGLMDEHGERNPAAKLSNNEVAQIRNMYAGGGFTMEQIGEKFGVRFQQVSRIVRGQRRRRQGGPIHTNDLRHNVCASDPVSGRFVSRKAV